MIVVALVGVGVIGALATIVNLAFVVVWLSAGNLERAAVSLLFAASGCVGTGMLLQAIALWKEVFE